MKKYLQRYSSESVCDNHSEMREEYRYRRQKSRQKKVAEENKDLLARWKR
jgi:hypothetical protein